VRSIRYWSILHAEGYPGSDHGIPGETPTRHRRCQLSSKDAGHGASAQVDLCCIKVDFVPVAAATAKGSSSSIEFLHHNQSTFIPHNVFRLRQLTVGLVFSTSSPCSRRTHMHAITHYCGSRTHSLCEVSTADGSRAHCRRISQYSLPRPRCSSLRNGDRVKLRSLVLGSQWAPISQPDWSPDQHDLIPIILGAIPLVLGVHFLELLGWERKA